MILKSLGPFDYHLSTNVIRLYTPQVFNYIEENKYRRVLRKYDEPFFVEAQFTIENGRTLISVRCSETSEDVGDFATRKIAWIFDLNRDLSPFYRLMEKQPVMKSIRDQLYGMKILNSATPYEALIEAIIEQQISKKASMTLRKRLAQKYSECIFHEGKEYYEFPHSQLLAEAKTDDLRTLGITSNKINAIKSISIMENQGFLSDLFTKQVETIYSELIKVKGIGRWTIQYALLRGLGRYDIFLQRDAALRAGVIALFGEDCFKSDYELDNFLSQYEGFAGYAAFYIIYANSLLQDKRRQS
jgi:DNA-3-methyladenine glycosylase II